jgi:RNA polymerase sigma-70 factor (ECF subfamily)
VTDGRPTAIESVERATTACDAGGERDLVEGLRRGDAGAAEALVRAHVGRMLAVARRVLGSEEDAWDAVQDAFLAAFQAIGSFHGDSRLGTWLHRIVVNASLMKLRSRSRRKTVSLEDLMPAFASDGHHAHDIPAWRDDSRLDAAERAELRASVRRRIDRLPEDYRVVVILRDIEGLDTGETAKALGISPGAVKVRLHRARQALRTLLEPILS